MLISFPTLVLIFHYVSCENPIPRSKYPFLVSIRTGPDYTQHICSGSLVGLSWILTAAHCVIDYTKTPLKIYIQAGELQDEKITRAAKIICHNKFDPGSYFSDVALILTVESFSPNPSINVIYAPKYTLNIEIRMECDYLEVLGLEMHAKYRRVVIERYVHEVLTDKDCGKRRKFKVMKHSFCGTAGNMTECLLDTGGPAICPGGNIIYGIVFYGCPWDQSPSYFTRVDRFLMFIEKNMKEESPYHGRKRIALGNKIEFNIISIIFSAFSLLVVK